MNPWNPITDPRTLRILGKLGEELGECSAATSRCIIQGLDECEPTTGKVNRRWLEEEIADVKANLIFAIAELGLDELHINRRADRKLANLVEWHGMVEA